jgi:hypothetical protein
MNPDLSIHPAVGATLEVDAAPIALRLPAGSAVFTVRGEAWITQERMADDVILGAGQRFDVPSRELLVISATRRLATLVVAEPAVARRHPMSDFTDFARSHAELLQREHSGQVLGNLGGALRELGRRMRMLVTPGRHPATQ